MQLPDPLPDFIGLTNQLADAVDPRHVHGVFDKDEEAPEVFLGKLDSNPHMREECVRILKQGVHSELHERIVALFGGDDMRIVTTNFDLRFESAAGACGYSPRVYEGPALPLGDSFTGIVHLHGSVTHPDEMVLTDADYGRAYISDGWASAFLVKMLSEYCVLFVGYSFGDAPMQYLARSVSSSVKGRVFVLDRDRKKAKDWERRGITPIHFADFSQLPGIFAEWRRHDQRTVFERSSLIEAIASSARVDGPFEEQVLKECFAESDDRIREAFAKAYARESHGFDALKVLVDAGFGAFLFNDDLDQRDQVFLEWAVDSFCISHYRELAILAQDAGKKLSRRFKASVIWKLAHDEATEECLAFWSHFIGASDIAGMGVGPINNLARIIEKCSSAEVAFSYMKIVFSVEAKLERSLLDETQIHCSPSMVLETDHFLEKLETAIMKHAVVLGERLFDYCISQLEEARVIETNRGVMPEAFDAWSFGRSAIEPHEQDEYSRGLSQVLISVARSTGEQLLVSKAASQRIVSRCVKSSSNVVARIGVHLLRLSDVEPDRALGMVVGGKWLRRHMLRHEVFLLLADCCPKASKAAQLRLLAEVERVYPDVFDMHDAYGRFNIMSWLLRFAPNDETLLLKREEAKQAFPNFQEREYPDLLSYSTAITGPSEDRYRIDEEAVTAEAMMSAFLKQPEEYVFHSGKEIVSKITRQYPAKALAVAAELFECETSVESCGLVSTILESMDWKVIAGEAPEQARQLLGRTLEEEGTYLAAVSSICTALDAGVFGDAEEIAEFEQCVEKVFAHLNLAIAECDSATYREGVDWVIVSANCAVGEAVDVLGRYAIRKLDAPDANELTKVERYLAILSNVLLQPTSSGHIICARSMFSIKVWASCAPGFVKDALLPQMHAGPVRRQAFWQGLSYLNRIPRPVWELVRDDWFNSLGETSESAEQVQRKLFGLFVGAVIMHEDENGPRIIKEVALSSDIACKETLATVFRWLRQLSSEEQKDEWGQWIKDVVDAVMDNEGRVAIALNPLIDLLFEVESISVDIARIVSVADCEPEESAYIAPDELSQLMGSLESDSNLKASLLSYLVKCHNCYLERQEVEGVINELEVDRIDEHVLIRLKDSIIIRGWAVPDCLL